MIASARSTLETNMQRFDALGQEIQAAWDRHSCDPAGFPEIATDALQKSKLLDKVSFDEVVEWCLTEPNLPKQKKSRFGQPPVRAYMGNGFYIEVLFWLDSPTSIHQHAFSGAFGVLHGGSFHSTYTFERDRDLAAQLRLGELHFGDAEMLQRGDVRTIRAGDRFIHALLHLNSPSVSVVIRTTSEPEWLPQYNYLAPGLAWDPFDHDVDSEMRFMLLRALYRPQPERFKHFAAEIVKTGDWWDCFRVARLTAGVDVNAPLAADILTMVRERDRTAADTIAHALREMHRESVISGMMKTAKDPEQRMLLAMLLHAPGRSLIEQLVQSRFPAEQPITAIARMIDSLAEQRDLGLKIQRPSLLLEPALRGNTYAEAESHCASFLGDRMPPASALRRDWYALHSLDLFRPLLRGAA